MSAPFDEGLQPERTLLAWRRTCLALVTISGAAARLIAAELGLVAIVVGLVGIGLAAGAYVVVARGYRERTVVLVHARQVPAGGGAFALLTASTVALAMAAAAYVMLRSFGQQ